jgi:hypothetical protein
MPATRSGLHLRRPFQRAPWRLLHPHRDARFTVKTSDRSRIAARAHLAGAMGNHRPYPDRYRDRGSAFAGLSFYEKAAPM